MDGSRRGRPMKRASELRPSRKIRNERAAALHRQLQGRSTLDPSLSAVLAPLESLPTEILQHIFFLALEVNLPRASLNIAKTLSDPAVYRAAVCFAFFDAYEDDPIEDVEAANFLPAEYRHLRLDEKLRLQRGILSSRWCTYEYLESCLPVLRRLAIVQQWHSEIRHCRSYDDTEQHYAESTHEDLTSIAALPSLDDHKALERHFMATSILLDRFSSDARVVECHDLLPRIVSWMIVWMKDVESDKIVWGKDVDSPYGIFNCRVFPDCLINGRPWTLEKVKMLKLCRQGLRFIGYCDRVAEISMDALFEGMRNAILQDQDEVLLVLLELHWAVAQLGDEHYRTDLTKIRRPVLGESLIHPIPLELFHLATRSPHKSSALVALLIRADIDTILKDDEALTVWALRKSEEGDPVGKWLLRFMENPLNGVAGSSTYCHLVPRPMILHEEVSNFWDERKYRQTFLNGAALDDKNSPPFPRKTFTQELGYVTDGRSPSWIPLCPSGRPCGSGKATNMHQNPPNTLPGPKQIRRPRCLSGVSCQPRRRLRRDND